MIKKNKTLSIGWLSTGNGQGSLGLFQQALDLHQEQKISLEYVFSNRDYGEKKGSDNFINHVKNNNINMITFSSRNYKSNKNKAWKELRNDFDKIVLSKISKHKVDIIIAAGYMLFSPVICNHYKILNLHPALPKGPIGTWKNVINELICKESNFSGISIHLMTPDLDEGPCVSYCKFNIKNKENINLWENIDNKKNDFEKSDLFLDIRKKMIIYERILLRKTLEKISSKEININDTESKNLSEEVNQLI
tara:strand:+ start:15347 stop:16096 length:750 start_codon:yes stop_codon:yes gene_type:complete